MPLATSLSLHAGLVVIALLCVVAFKTVRSVPVEQPEGPIPVTQVEPTPVDLHHWTSDGQDPLPVPVPKGVGTGSSSVSKFNVSPSSPPLNGDIVPTEPLIVTGDSFLPRKPGGKSVPGGSGDTGVPSFDGGRGGIFDGRVGGGPAGHAKPATSIAFVCDASGSMLEKMPALQRELTNAVMKLRPFQKFSIIFFHDEQPIALSTQLLLPTPENKRAASAFLDHVSPHGTTDPIPGIRLAFAEHPQVMFLLTDGDFPNNGAVLAEIRSLEKIHHVQVNTIAFTGSADNQTDLLVLLKQVAQETGGTFKPVNAEALESGN
ncbi:MAG TPA: hypothetical protein VHY37_02430 [Tepidisphaeraceae bacterium]|nr:hypothetical protein [Tepidisphaeraceae bacterium]